MATEIIDNAIQQNKTDNSKLFVLDRNDYRLATCHAIV